MTLVNIINNGVFAIDEVRLFVDDFDSAVGFAVDKFHEVALKLVLGRFGLAGAARAAEKAYQRMEKRLCSGNSLPGQFAKMAVNAKGVAETFVCRYKHPFLRGFPPNFGGFSPLLNKTLFSWYSNYCFSMNPII